MSRSLLRLDLSDAARDRLVAVSALPVAVPIQAHNRIRLWRPAYDSAHSARNARINPASRLPPSGAIPFVRADIDSSGIAPQTNSPGIAWKAYCTRAFSRATRPALAVSRWSAARPLGAPETGFCENPNSSLSAANQSARSWPSARPRSRYNSYARRST